MTLRRYPNGSALHRYTKHGNSSYHVSFRVSVFFTTLRLLLDEFTSGITRSFLVRGCSAGDTQQVLKSFLVSVQAQVTAGASEGKQQIILEHGSIYALSRNISFHHCNESILRVLQGRNMNGNVRIRNVIVCFCIPTFSGNAFSGTVAQKFGHCFWSVF